MKSVDFLVVWTPPHHQGQGLALFRWIASLYLAYSVINLASYCYNIDIFRELNLVGYCYNMDVFIFRAIILACYCYNIDVFFRALICEVTVRKLIFISEPLFGGLLL